MNYKYFTLAHTYLVNLLYYWKPVKLKDNNYSFLYLKILQKRTKSVIFPYVYCEKFQFFVGIWLLTHFCIQKKFFKKSLYCRSNGVDCP